MDCDHMLHQQPPRAELVAAADLRLELALVPALEDLPSLLLGHDRLEDRTGVQEELQSDVLAIHAIFLIFKRTATCGGSPLYNSAKSWPITSPSRQPHTGPEAKNSFTSTPPNFRTIRSWRLA